MKGGKCRLTSTRKLTSSSRSCRPTRRKSPAVKPRRNAIEAFGPLLPEFLGGSADLAPSNLTLWSGSKPINEDAAGNYIHYGVRRFRYDRYRQRYRAARRLPAVHLHLPDVRGIRARNAVRMAALMKQRRVMVYTHDSIGLGEDGPTHQPVEQVASLRVTPNMSTWRPCDQVESSDCVEIWRGASGRPDRADPLPSEPGAAGAVPQSSWRTWPAAVMCWKECAGQPELIFIATGSKWSWRLPHGTN
ncbi:hypothetical protein LNQ03_07420 [Klebsiella pneumoniae subsp. pneumoniae]|nr:hypothetical protein [Klebsiella pneumoniae subsp. pneumoniae]